ADADRLAGGSNRHAEVRHRHRAGADREILRGPLGEAEKGRAGQLVAAPDDTRITRVRRGARVVAPATRGRGAVALEEGLLVECRTRPKDDLAGVHLAGGRRTLAGLRTVQRESRSTATVVKHRSIHAARSWR